MRRVATLWLGLAILSTACAARAPSSPGPDRSQETRLESVRTWARPRPDPSGRISVEGFGAHVASTNPEWMESPIHQTLEFLGIRGPDAFTTTILQEANPDGGRGATISVTKEGLSDDSVDAVRYVLDFRRDQGGTWELEAATWAWSCAPRRGHQGFSTELCT